MTMPDERTRALLSAYSFMTDLLDPKKTPGVPSSVRKRASGVLRHYPSRGELWAIAVGISDLDEKVLSDDTVPSV